MAQKSDGSLVFKTKLDNTDFKKGAQELEQEAKNTTKRVNAAGKSAGEGFGSIDTSKSQKALSDLGKAADKTAGKIRDASKQKIKVNDSVDTQGFEKGTSRMQAAMDSLKQRAVKFGGDLKNAIGAAFVSNAPTIKSVDQLKEMLKEMGGTVGEVFKSDSITDFGKSLGDLEAQLQKFGSTKFISDGQIFNGSEIEGDFTEVQQVVKEGREKLAAEFEKLDPSEKLQAETELTKQAVQRFGEAVQSIQDVKNPQDAWQIVDGLKAQMESYESMPFAKLDVSQDMGRVIDEVSATLSAAQEKWDSTHFDTSPFDAAFQGMASKLREIPTLTQQSVSGVAGVSNALAGFAGKVAGFGYSIYQGLRDPLGAVNKVLGLVTSAAGKAVSGVIGLAKAAGGAAVGSIKKLAVHAKEAAINLAKMVPNMAISGLKKLGGVIFGTGNAASQMGNSFKLTFGSIAKYALGLAGLKMTFSGLANAIRDGVMQFAAGDAQLQSNINSLKTALAGLKISLGAAFAPIASIVLPYITAMVNALATAINYVGMFIAALTGKSTYKKAAANMGTVSNAADHAAKSAKEAKRQLAGFDKLEILSDTSGGGGGGGAGGGGGGGGPTFEEVAIDSGIADWAQKLKDMWAAGDYEGIGKVIADGINSAFAKLDELIKWDNVGGVITKYVDAFCRIFNSMVDNIDWALIGKTFGDGVNTILHTANLLLTGINWDNLGKKFSEGLNKFVDTIDWDLLGETIANKFGAKIDFLSSAVENFNWGKLGENLAKGINSFVTTLKSHLDKIDWKKIGKGLADGVNKLVHGINMDEIGKTIGETLTKALNGLSAFLEDVNWQEIGHKAKELVAGINWDELTSALYEAMGAAFGAVAGIIWGFIKDGLTNIRNYFDNSIDEAGGNVALGILNGIHNGFNKIEQWVKDNIIKPFVDGFKKAFQIGSPAKNPELVDAAGWVGEGILKAIADKFLDIGGWIKTNILDKIVGALKKGKDKVGEALDILGNGAKTVKKTVKITISKIANKAGEAWEFVKSGAQTIKKTVQTILEKLGNWKDEAWQAVKDGAKTVKKTVQAAFKKVGDWSGEAWSAVKSGAQTIQKKVQATLEKIGDWASDAWSAFKSGSESVKKSIQVALEQVGNWASDAWEVFSSGAQTVQKTVQVTLEKAGGWASDAWDLIKNGAETIRKTVQTVYEDVTSGNSAADIPQGDQDITATITLRKSGWTSIANFVGTAVSVGISLWKNGWTAIHTWVGNTVSVGIELWHNGWRNIAGYVGTAVSVGISIWKHGWSSLSSFVGTSVSVAISIWRKGWSSLSNWVGTTTRVGVRLWKSGWSSIRNFVGTSVSVGVSLVKKGASWLWNIIHRARGGVFANGRWSNIPQYASGGVVGARRFAKGIPQYASGGTPHGTAFVAGERGPEIVGHIGGRTEVLNKSQLASTMYSAVVNGMGAIGGRIGEAICNKIADSSNAQIGALQAISSQIAYTAPLMASGTVVPYAITKADIAEIGTKIEASNDELQSVLVQAIAQAANLIVGAVQNIDTTTTIDQNMITRRTIEDINRRTLMFQTSPLK